MKFYLTIDCGNAAFEGDQLPVEVSRILRRVANQVKEFNDDFLPGWRRPVRDANGNTCGSYEFIG